MILIVDDKRENVYPLKRLLETNEFEVDTAYSGEEALKKIHRNSYALVMVDVQMPGIDSFEVAEIISGYNKTEELPVIFLSAINIEKRVIPTEYASGRIDFITKPLDPEILLLKVKTFYRLSEQTRKLNTAHLALQKENEFRKKAEAELHSRINELHSFIEAIPHIAFTVKNNGTIEFVNRLWYTYAENAATFPETHEQDPSVLTCLKIACMHKERSVSEIRIKQLATNQYRYHLLTATPVEIDGVIIKWACTLTDINEQKSVTALLEERVKERTKELQTINSRLEESNEQLQQFASVASHDLKEPLRKIETFAGIIKAQYLKGNASGISYIDRIMSSSKRMTQLINNLLSYSSLSITDAFEFVTIKTIIDDVILDLEHVIEEKKAIININSPQEVELIPYQMRQVFQNILSNALKFSRKDISPVITINCERVAEKSPTGTLSESGNFYRISIRDNGIGFDERYQERIFEVFKRLNSKSQYEGNGIGLAIVKKIISKHDGVISATGKINEGACFIFVLPLKQQVY